MVSWHSEYFDLPTLLKEKNLHVRQFALNVALPVSDYFELLSKFVRLAPNADSAMKKFKKRDGDKEAYKTLDDMTSLLKNLGCNEFVSEFHIILGAYETGNWRLAAHHAEKVIDSFNEFYSRIKAAKRTRRAVDTTLSLKEVIEHLDDEETSRRKIILAVDDSPVILKSVSSVLSDVYKVYTLPKPTELEKILHRLTPDLFLLDYQMPEINGFELIPIIRKFEEHKNTPVIFLTSMGTVDTLTAAIALGACDFVVKPFNPDVLREKIAKNIVSRKIF